MECFGQLSGPPVRTTGKRQGKNDILSKHMAPKSIAVVQGNDNQGRVTVATHPLAPGDVVLEERAVACVATAGRPLCDDCLTSVASKNGCRTSNRQCADCMSLLGHISSKIDSEPRGTSTNTRVPSSAVRLAAKILLRRFSGSLRHEQVSRIDSLVHQQQHSATNHEKISSSSYSQDEEECVQVAKIVSADYVAANIAHPLLPLNAHDEKAGPSNALLDLARTELCRVSLNAITTCDGSGATGLGLFLSAAMFNHSCVPNCQAWWKGSKLEIRCTKPVAAGEELCFSYIPIDQPSTLRRAQLRRCTSGQWDTELTGLRCPSVSCAGAMRAYGVGDDESASCNQCGFPVARTPSQSSTTGVGSSCSAPPAGSSPQEMAAINRGVGESLRAARRDFEDGMEAYMQEDPQVALVALEKSLLIRERILHPYNKELLRTLRYAGYAAVATHSWAKAESFLSRWLHPMETMFGAAEIWDIAAMRIDAGLVLDKLHGSIHSIEETGPASPRPLAGCGGPKNKPSMQRGAANRHRIHPAAYNELSTGLRWLWACLGKNSGLDAEIAALEVCSGYGIQF